jgi:hypothetical protein
MYIEMKNLTKQIISNTSEFWQHTAETLAYSVCPLSPRGRNSEDTGMR